GVNNLLGKFEFQFVRRAEACAAGRSFSKSRYNFRIGVTKNHRPPRADVINISASVDIGDSGAARAANEKRRPANSTKSADGRVNAARQQFKRAGEKFFGGVHDSGQWSLVSSQWSVDKQ